MSEPDLSNWRWHVLDTRVNKLAAVYATKRAALQFMKYRNEVWRGRFKLIDTKAKDPTGLGRLVGGYFRE